MNEVRTGETVRVQMNGIDESGKVMSSVVWETYGYTNDYANRFQNAVVTKLVELSQEMNAFKNT